MAENEAAAAAGAEQQQDQPGGDPPPESQDHLANGADGDGDATPTNEEKALTMGWAPRDQWRGPADRWVDADTFVQRAQDSPAMMAERYDHVSGQLAEERAAREQDRQDFDLRITRSERMGQVALERQRAQLNEGYEAQKRKAVEDADTDRYDALSQQQAADVAELDEKAEAAVSGGEHPGSAAGAGTGSAAPIPPVWQDAIDPWARTNTWYGTDPELTQLARYHHVKLQNEQPGLSPAENLQRVRDAVAEAYPAKFGGTAPAAGNGSDTGGAPPRSNAPPAAAAEGGSRGGGRSNRSQTARNLPPEARTAGERFVKQELFKDLEEYATDYFAQEGATT